MKRFLAIATVALLAALGTAVAADTPACPKAAAAATHDCCLKMDGVEKTVANLDNGVKITLAAKDEKVVAKLQEMVAAKHDGAKACAKDCPMHEKGVTRSVEKTKDGVVVTATATEAEMVKKLQTAAAAASCTKGEKTAACCPKGEKAGSGCPKAKEKGGCPHAAKDATAKS